MISVVISAHNEEKNIGSAIDSLSNFADEIIVIDNESTDKTADIAKKKGAVIYHQKNDPLRIDFQKNFGFTKATKTWILSLDADERLTPKLIQEIKNTLEYDHETDGYYIPRKNIIFGKWIRNSIWWPDYQLRLFRKGKGKFDGSTVHKQITIKGNVKHLSEPFIHESYVSIEQYVSKMNTIYTEVEAEKIFKDGKRLHVVSALRMPIEDFLKTFFLQKGYRDGLHGLMLSTLQSFYTFLVVAKVWEKQGFYEKDSKDVLSAIAGEERSISSQLKYWLTSSFLDESRNPLRRGIYYIARKFSTIFS